MRTTGKQEHDGQASPGRLRPRIQEVDSGCTSQTREQDSRTQNN
jgi:hypothetical protein